VLAARNIGLSGCRAEAPTEPMFVVVAGTVRRPPGAVAFNEADRGQFD